MSLVSTASLWNGEQTKKRVPTMKRQTMKLRNDNLYSIHDENTTSIQNNAEKSEENSIKIKNLIQNLSSNDGDRLADFEPLERPELNKKKDEYDFEPEHVLPQTVEHKPTEFSSNQLHLDKLSNYQDIYSISQSKPTNVPANVPANSNQLMEKINYMIHLLEQQHAEKVDNITEEFILYVLLGVFVIFTVDSFTRVGKYVR